jgi:predicted dehydrogenase
LRKKKIQQVSAGRKCFLNFEIDGDKASVYWNQEAADQMWMGFRDKDNLNVMRNPLLMTREACQYTYLPAGHPEGWNDALRNNIYSFYKFIADGKVSGKDPHDFATFDDGHYIILLTEAILKSNESKSWVKVK